MMDSRELMTAAMRRERADRIPCMPQICHDVAVRIYAPQDGEDWLDALARCLEDPGRVYDYVIRLVEDVGCDGLRLFVMPEALKVSREGEELVVLDRETGNRIGRIDTHGGARFVADQPRPPVETLEEVQARLEQMVADFTDEKLTRLQAARDRVPSRFVASAPGGITMNTYNELRGREQAMFDFYERPQFVEDVMRMQADAVIQRAELLLGTGIDALYIGDPSASGSLIGPQAFERFCLPAYQQFCRHFRGRDVLIYIHICGNSNPILEMMADTGAHVVEPLDPLGGVSVADAKEWIGDRVALMGGVNTLTLSNGSREEVEAEAIQKCREGGPNGYILAAGDMVPPDTPFANLRAMVNVSTKSLWLG